MNASYINPFLNAVTGLFETMFEQSVRLGKPALKKEPAASHAVSSVIQMQGQAQGCVVVSFPKTVALALASALLDETIDRVDEDCIDALGEIANIIAGNARNEFPDDAGAMSVPGGILDKATIVYPPGVPIISIPCDIDDGELVIDVALAVS